jgi:hypothetical protein
MAISQPKPIADGAGPAIAAKRLVWEGDLFGNNNYQTTGDLYTASQFGMSGFTMINLQDRDSTDTYTVTAIFPANSSNSSEAFAPAPANFNLHYFSANGTEVGNNSNLATSAVRAQLWGL